MHSPSLPAAARSSRSAAPLLLLAALALLVCGALTGCTTGSGVALTREREAEGFEFVTADLPGRYEIVQADTRRLVVTTDDNLLDLTETFVSGDVLFVTAREKFSPRAGLTVEVASPVLRGVSAKQGAEILIARLDADSFEITVEGDAIVVVQGKANRVEIVSNGGAPDVDASRLVAREVDVQVLGEAVVDVHATQKLSARMSGGLLRHVVKPRELDPQLSGQAVITQVSLQELQSLRLSDPRATGGASGADSGLPTYLREGATEEAPPARQKKTPPKKKTTSLDDFEDDFSTPKDDEETTEETTEEEVEEAPKTGKGARQGFDPDAFGEPSDEEEGEEEEEEETPPPRKTKKTSKDKGFGADAFDD